MSIIVKQELALIMGSGMAGSVRWSNRGVAVESLADASEKWCIMRDRMDWSGSDCPHCKVVDVLTGKDVATISYNGRVWDLKGEEIQIGDRPTAQQYFAKKK